LVGTALHFSIGIHIMSEAAFLTVRIPSVCYVISSSASSGRPRLLFSRERDLATGDEENTLLIFTSVEKATLYVTKNQQRDPGLQWAITRMADSAVPQLLRDCLKSGVPWFCVDNGDVLTILEFLIALEK
jgi:hypothetical protein